MVNKYTYRKNPVFVENILEIRLCEDLWRKVRVVAARQGVSFSWVVRYAVFRLIKRKNINNFLSLKWDFRANPVSFEDSRYQKRFERAKARRPHSSLKHRHRLCLYGDDELYIRIAAARLSCTMTHLVRFALECYLDELVSSPILSKFDRDCGKNRGALDAFWYWLGIKLHTDVEFPTLTSSDQYIKFKRFPQYEYF